MILLTRLYNLMRSYVNAKNLGFFFSIIMQPYVNLGSEGQAAGYDKEKDGIQSLAGKKIQDSINKSQK